MKQKINSLGKIFLFFTVAFLGSAIYANATYIKTSASGTDYDGGEYSYLFTIQNDTNSSLIYHAKLTNTSDASSSPEALIDAVGFNLLDPDPALGTDFTIENISPVWEFVVASGGIKFDYVGERDNPDDRLGVGESLTFDFVFDPGYTPLPDPALSYFDLFLLAEKSTGGGLGGGDDVGQVGVSFQQLYDEVDGAGEGSDLLASNWDGPYDGQIQDITIPEPATFMLFGIGLLGLARVSRRKK